MLGKWRQPDPWGSLAAQPKLVGEFQVKERPYSWGGGNKNCTVPEEWHSRLFSYTHACIPHLQTCLCDHAPAHPYERESNKEKVAYAETGRGCLVWTATDIMRR